MANPLTETNITCPHTHASLVKLTADGLSVRCQHCTMQEHYLTWQEFDVRRAAVMPEPLKELSPLALPQRKRRKRGVE